MAGRNFFISFLLILALSIVGISLWLFEIVQMKGWYSLSWLHETLFAPYFVTILAVLAFLIPFQVYGFMNFRKTLFPALILYVISIVCYEFGKYLCFKFYTSFYEFTMLELISMSSISLLLFLILGLSYWLVSNMWMKMNRKTNSLYIALSTLLTIPLSLLAIRIFPCFGSGTNWIDAVKMGYPVFWMIASLGISGLMISKQKSA